MERKAGLMGRKSPRPDPRRPRLAHFTTVSLPAASLDIDWTLGRMDWLMLGNDTKSNCTAVALSHQLMCWFQNLDGMPYDVSQAAADDLYLAATMKEGNPWNPLTGANDNGAYMADVLQIAEDYGIEGQKIDGWLSVEAGHLDETRFGMETFGGALVGMALPASAKEQYDASVEWSVVSPWSASGRPGTWGEHEVFIPRADPDHLYAVTWGKLQPMTNNFFLTYADDIAIAVYRAFLNRHCYAGQHIAKEEMRKALAGYRASV